MTISRRSGDKPQEHQERKDLHVKIRNRARVLAQRFVRFHEGVHPN